MSLEPIQELSVGPVWDLDAEAIVLSAILSRPELVDLVQARIHPDDFIARPNWAMYAAMCGLRKDEKEITPATVHWWLGANDRLGDVEMGEGRDGGIRYLSRIVCDTPDHSTNIDRFLDRILEKARLRRAKWVAQQIHIGAQTYGGDVQTFIDRAVEAFREIADRQDMLSMMRLSDVLHEKFKHWSLAKEGRTANGLSAGFTDLDAVTGGLRAESLNLLAARPGVGKSALALNIATRVAGSGGGVAFFSLEMSREELSDRILSAVSAVPLSVVAHRREQTRTQHLATDDIVDQAAVRISEHPIWIDDRGRIALADVRAKAKRVDNDIRRHGGDGLQLIVVDYVGLMQEPPGARSREQAIAANSRGLKLLAKEMKIPVLLLCQMNRDIEKRNGEPKLSDLRESGALEQDADCIMFLHREDSGDDDRKDGPTKLIVAKNRSGPCGAIWLMYTGNVTRFDQMIRDNWPKPTPKRAPTSRYQPREGRQ